MKCIEKTWYEDLPIGQFLRMPDGLLGVESCQQVRLTTRPEEAPFLWLEWVDGSKTALLAMPPSILYPTYQPEIGPNDAKCLGVNTPADAWMLNLVTLYQDGRATINLQGPIVINRKSLVARQVVPVNVLHFNLHHPLPVIRDAGG